MSDFPIARVNLSLPCCVPVLPGTDDTSAPIELRTERCATDAWWIIGRAPICDRHLRRVLGEMGEDYDGLCAELHVHHNDRELVPFADAYRYSQEDARPL